VWTHLAPWLVKTGEVPQLEVGDTLRGAGVHASCWSLDQARGPEGIVELHGADPAGDSSPHYELTGTVEWVAEGSPEVLLRVEGLGFVAGPRAAGYPADFRLPDVGAPVTAVARLEALALYDAGAPDVRRDWLVRAIKVEHRALVSSPDYPGQTEPGAIVRVDDIGRMLRWADASSRDHASYLLDLEPLLTD
jgi:hypothetical protein